MFSSPERNFYEHIAYVFKHRHQSVTINWIQMKLIFFSVKRKSPKSEATLSSLSSSNRHRQLASATRRKKLVWSRTLEWTPSSIAHQMKCEEKWWWQWTNTFVVFAATIKRIPLPGTLFFFLLAGNNTLRNNCQNAFGRNTPCDGRLTSCCAVFFFSIRLCVDSFLSGSCCFIKSHLILLTQTHTLTEWIDVSAW